MNYGNYSRNTAALTSPSSNRYGNNNYVAGTTSPRNPRLTEGIGRTKSMRAVDTPGRGLGRTSTRNGLQTNYAAGSGNMFNRENNRMFKSNIHGNNAGLRYHSPTKDVNMNKSHTFFGRNQNEMKASYAGGNRARTGNMTKSFAFGNSRNERNTYNANNTNFNELAKMKRSHGPLGLKTNQDNESTFRTGRATSMTGGRNVQTEVKNPQPQENLIKNVIFFFNYFRI